MREAEEGGGELSDPGLYVWCAVHVSRAVVHVSRAVVHVSRARTRRPAAAQASTCRERWKCSAQHSQRLQLVSRTAVRLVTGEPRGGGVFTSCLSCAQDDSQTLFTRGGRGTTLATIITQKSSKAVA